MILELILIYFVYLVIIILGSYYIDLFLSKDQYTKKEIKNSLPYFSKLLDTIKHTYSITSLVVIVSATSLLGILLPVLIQHWLTNSAIFFAVLFFILPLLKKQLEKYKVSDSENPLDNLSNIIIRYDDIILIGLGLGTASAIILNWGTTKFIPFLWFLVNIIIISILLGITFYKFIKK